MNNFIKIEGLIVPSASILTVQLLSRTMLHINYSILDDKRDYTLTSTEGEIQAIFEKIARDLCCC